MTDLPEKLKNYISAELNYWDFSGVIRVIKDSATLYETSRGFASIEFDVKNTMETRFVAASVCKQFTAFAIMLLYDRGLLQLGNIAMSAAAGVYQSIVGFILILTANLVVHRIDKESALW